MHGSSNYRGWEKKRFRSFQRSPSLPSPLNNSFFEAAISQVRSTIAYLGEYSYWGGVEGRNGADRIRNFTSEMWRATPPTSRALISFPPRFPPRPGKFPTPILESWIESRLKNGCSISIWKKGTRRKKRFSILGKFILERNLERNVKE